MALKLVSLSHFQTGERRHSGQVSELLSYFRTKGHYQGFICALIEADQGHVVTDILAVDVNKYKQKFILKG